MKFDTIAVHGSYNLEQASLNQGSILEPIYLSSAEAFKNSDDLEAAMLYQKPAWGYTRITNPSILALENTLALLESYQGAHFGNLSCHVTSSGMAAVFMATNPFLALDRKKSPINFVASAQCYGGTFMLFSERYQNERGIEVRWVKNAKDLNEWQSKIDSNTRFLYGEMPSNPGLGVFDIKAVSEIAHSAGLPLLVDSTLATPALMRPVEFGADIVIHSLSKSISASGVSIAGAIVSKKNIPSRIGPDEMKEDFCTYVKLHPARDFGPSLSPMNAILTLNELRTLRSRIKTMSDNAMKVAQYLEKHPSVESVNYPGLKNSPAHELASKYMFLVDSEKENAYGHLMSFCVKGGAEAARDVLDGMKMIFIATDLGRVKTIANIPAISTHQQQGEAARELAQIPNNLIRLSVGCEDPVDIIFDLENALSSGCAGSRETKSTAALRSF